MSFGGTAVFRWRRQSCPSDEGGSCRLDHGDILVMDGQCQDEFLHRADPGREQERINITFRWVKQHVSSCTLFRACCLPTCAQGLSVPVTGDFGFGFGDFWAIWLLPGVLYMWGLLVFFWPPYHVQNLGYFGAPRTGHALWALLGRDITFLSSWKHAWQLIKLHIIFVFFRFMGISCITSHICWP